MGNKDDEEELPLKYNKSGLIRGAGFRKKRRESVGTKLTPEVIEAWKVTAQRKGVPLNQVLSDLIMAEFDRLSENQG